MRKPAQSPAHCIAYLRRMAEPGPGQPRYILTDRGVGYRLAADET